MKKTKLLMIAGILLLATTLVSATIATNYGVIQTNIHVKNPILVDKEPWDGPIVHEIDEFPGTTVQYTHTFENIGPLELLFEWEHTGTPDLEGIDIELTAHGEPLGLQFTLEPNESLDITFRFVLWNTLAPGDYVVESHLIPGYR
jgi:hypothetical protein